MMAFYILVTKLVAYNWLHLSLPGATIQVIHTFLIFWPLCRSGASKTTCQVSCEKLAQEFSESVVDQLEILIDRNRFQVSFFAIHRLKISQHWRQSEKEKERGREKGREREGETEIERVRKGKEEKERGRLKLWEQERKEEKESKLETEKNWESGKVRERRNE